MSRIGRVWILLWVLGSLSAVANEEPQRTIVWDRLPIQMTLKVGQQRNLVMPKEVRVGVPDNQKDIIDVGAANGVVFLTALQSFEKIFLRVEEPETGIIYPIEISFDPNSPSNDLVIVNPAYVTKPAEKQSDEETTELVNEEDWRSRLVRFASQSIYGLDRLIEPDSEITRVDVDTLNQVDLLNTENVSSTPIKAYRGGGIYVTAFLLQNESPRTINLHLIRDIKYLWLGRVLQHTQLAPKGSDADQTILYLVSEKPIKEILHVKAKKVPPESTTSDGKATSPKRSYRHG